MYWLLAGLIAFAALMFGLSVYGLLYGNKGSVRG